MAKPANPVPKFVLPTIEERDRMHPPKRSREDRRSRISFVERESILLMWVRGLSPPRIARVMGMGASTVRDAIVDVYSCPSVLLRMRVYELARTDRKTWWRCLLCGEYGPGGKNSALKHILHEVYPDFGWVFHEPGRLTPVKAQSYLASRSDSERQRRDPWSFL